MSNYGPPPDPFQSPDSNQPPSQPYGAPPPSYGQPPAYGGQYPQQPYGAQQPNAQQPYPQQPYGGSPYPGYGAPQMAYSHWIKRVGGTLLDYLISAVVAIPAIIGMVVLFSGVTTYKYPDNTTTSQITNHGAFDAGLIIAIVGYILAIGFGIWNQFVRQGRTGQTIGKRIVGIRLVKEVTGQPLGGWLCFGRQLLHILDSIACYLGWLWPLWDSKRQTFADKLVSSVVVDA